jgi:transmembrane sensor
VVTGAEDLATVQLADGSVARLAPRSRLRLVVSDSERIVWLQGRAFFAVASQPGRPFRVRTNGGDAIALGTRFGVETEARGLRLVVVEGRVALSANGAATEVGGGHAAGLIDGRASRTVRVRDATEELRWMGRFLAFQSTPLPSVAAEIERVYGVRITVADSALAQETVSAAFTDESFHQVVSVVCTVVGARCTISNSSATIGR